MTGPTPDLRQIDQADLDNFAAEFETVKTALAAYIAQLVAGQAVPLSAADEAGLTQALGDLTALEPPPVQPPASG